MVDRSTARQYIYSNANLWERALYAHVFQDDDADKSAAHLRDCLRAYKNPDNGYGHGLEPDIRTPSSNPAALEYLLKTLVFFEIAEGDLLNGTPHWLESVQQTDGALRQPDDLQAYPLAPWWVDMSGQTQPTSIVGNLSRLGYATESLKAKTRAWVTENLTIDAIEDVDWLFMNYHAFDYFMNVDDFPNVERYREATIGNIIRCAENATPAQLIDIFSYVPAPDAPAADKIPSQYIEQALDYLEENQTESGFWVDEHDLTQWYPMTTIRHLVILRRFGRLDTD